MSEMNGEIYFENGKVVHLRARRTKRNKFGGGGCAGCFFKKHDGTCGVFRMLGKKRSCTFECCIENRVDRSPCIWLLEK